MAVDAGDDLAARYEALRRVAHGDGLAAAGLAGSLLVARGVAGWMRGWRACTPLPAHRDIPTRPVPPGEVVGVLAAMALACV